MPPFSSIAVSHAQPVLKRGVPLVQEEWGAILCASAARPGGVVEGRGEVEWFLAKKRSDDHGKW